MTAEIHGTAEDRVRRTRQRYTSGRRHIVELLADLGRPVTITDLLEAGATQSQSSLYRNLAVLEQCNVVHRLTSIDDVARYELDEDLTEHHHHLVCQSCGRIDDVTLPAELEASLHAVADDASQEHGYDLDGHRLELVGTCHDCR